MTDPDAEALLRAIVRHADDDTPRVVYADWLEENGRCEEAEFLRVQCRLAAADPDDREYPTLIDRDEELRLWLTAHVPGPRLAFPAGLSVEGGTHWWWQTQRGYPRFLTYDGTERSGTKAMRSLASAVAKAFEVLPTRWLVVSDITVRQLATLLKQRVLGGLRELTLQLTLTEDEATEAARLLANCRHLRNIRGLSLAFGLSDAACESLASASWDPLEWFSNNYPISPSGLQSLAGASWFRRLRKLTLENDLPNETFEELAALPAFRRLRSLDLTGNNFSEDSWRAFAQTTSFPALAELRLHGCDLSGARFEALAGAGGFELHSLNASVGAADPGGGAAIVAAPWASSLRILDLASNWFNATDLKAVAASKKFHSLRSLSMANTHFGPASLSALAANPVLRELQSLDLGCGTHYQNPSVKPGHFDRFLAKLDMPDLRRLDLSGWSIGPKVARKLTDPKFASLTRLGLCWCKINDAALKALVTSPALRNLIELELYCNNLGAGAEILTDRSVLPRLASCTLDDNAIPTTITRKLRRRAGVRT